MEVGSPIKPVDLPHSPRSRRGGKGRPPSPDSACEHELTSDQSEESCDTARSHRRGGPSPRRKSDSGGLKGGAGQDSDVDSGIVACGKPGQRIGSTSSADTDSSQESRRRPEYSPPLPKSDLTKSRLSNGSLRITKHASLSDYSGPIKGDHLILKECNRRPPTPLSVFPETSHCVRFDEQLQLSEQNIRRSCRKLFATLYAQRFSYPSRPSSALPPGRGSSPGSVRGRSRTAPELELRRYSPISVDGRFAREHRASPVEGRRAEALAHGRIHARTAVDPVVASKVPLQPTTFQLRSYPMPIVETRPTNSPLIDPSLSSYHRSNAASQCTCPPPQHSSSQTPASCTCQGCSCEQPPPGLYKSSSCSTLPAVLSHQSRPQLTQFPLKLPRKTQPEPQLQKTSSCSSIVDAAGLQLSRVPVYSDNMVHVYARMASVVPEELASRPPSQGGRRARALSKLRQNAVDSVYVDASTRPSSACTVSSRADSVRTEGEKTALVAAADVSQDLETLRTNYANSTGKGRDPDSKSVHSDIYSQVGEVGNVSVSSNRSLKERTPGRMYCQRPKSVGVVVPSPVYLKSALKKPTQNAMQNVNDSTRTNDENAPLVEVEYAVVDKSKKNRVNSMPSLNGAPTSPENDDKDHPPIPPKKHLCKSDFSLNRSRSSSPKKSSSLLSRMQTMTRNARTVLQKAFSTERIYRPEREERIEASGHPPLQRSKSFIKSITGSFRRKKRKPRNVMAEVMTHSSPDSVWNDSPDAPASPHVRGQLLQLNLDGSQVVELIKPPAKPYGFFVARGRVRNSKGVFVSRMRDQETQKELEGLLDIGDEILEIDGTNVKDADIMEVNRLMANRNTLLLTVLPYICRKDI